MRVWVRPVGQRPGSTADANDDCGVQTFENDRTPGGGDASGDYPCGDTVVTFTATDVQGNVGTCRTTVAVAGTGVPTLGCPPAFRIESRREMVSPTPDRLSEAIRATARGRLVPNTPRKILPATNEGRVRDGFIFGLGFLLWVNEGFPQSRRRTAYGLL